MPRHNEEVGEKMGIFNALLCSRTLAQKRSATLFAFVCMLLTGNNLNASESRLNFVLDGLSYQLVTPHGQNDPSQSKVIRAHDQKEVFLRFNKERMIEAVESYFIYDPDGRLHLVPGELNSVILQSNPNEASDKLEEDVYLQVPVGNHEHRMASTRVHPDYLEDRVQVKKLAQISGVDPTEPRRFDRRSYQPEHYFSSLQAENAEQILSEARQKYGVISSDYVEESLSLTTGLRRIDVLGHPLNPILIAYPIDQREDLVPSSNSKLELVVPVIDATSGFSQRHEYFLLKQREDGDLGFEKLSIEGPRKKTDGPRLETLAERQSCGRCHHVKESEIAGDLFQLGGLISRSETWGKVYLAQETIMSDHGIRYGNDSKLFSALCTDLASQIFEFTGGQQEQVRKIVAELFALSLLSQSLPQLTEKEKARPSDSPKTFPFLFLQHAFIPDYAIEHASQAIEESSEFSKFYASYKKLDFGRFAAPSDVLPSTTKSVGSGSFLTLDSAYSKKLLYDDRGVRHSLPKHEESDGVFDASHARNLAVARQAGFDMFRRTKLQSRSFSDLLPSKERPTPLSLNQNTLPFYLLSSLPHCFKLWESDNRDIDHLNELQRLPSDEVASHFETALSSRLFDSPDGVFPSYAELDGESKALVDGSRLQNIPKDYLLLEEPPKSVTAAHGELGQIVEKGQRQEARWALDGERAKKWDQLPPPGFPVYGDGLSAFIEEGIISGELDELPGLLKKYCFRCHNGDQYDLKQVYEFLKFNEMPPASSSAYRRMSEEDYLKMVTQLSDYLKKKNLNREAEKNKDETVENEPSSSPSKESDSGPRKKWWQFWR